MTTPRETASLETSLPSHPKSNSERNNSSLHFAKDSKLKECSNTFTEEEEAEASSSLNDSHKVPDADADADDWTSPSSSSSSEEESDSQSDSEDVEYNKYDGDGADTTTEETGPAKLTHLRPFPKPTTKFMQNSDLRDRLSQFIPALKAANEELERDIAAGNGNTRSVEIGQENEGQGRYIEMDLGLGVLEEKRSSDADTESSDENNDEDENSDSDEEMSGQQQQQPQEKKRRTQKKNSNVLEKLLGEETRSKKPTIEEMDR